MANQRPYLIDVSRLIWRRWAGLKPTGIDRVCLAYLRHYGARAQAVVQRDGCCRIFDPEASDRLFDALLTAGTGVKRKIVAALAAGIIRGSRGDNDGRIYFNLGHTGLERPGLARWIRRSRVRPIYMVHDLIPITHPEYCRPEEEAKHDARMRTVLGTAFGVIGNSRATIESLSDFARLNDLPSPPSVAAWLGVDNFVDVPGHHDASEGDPTFIVVGTIEGRKNHAVLLDVWDRLAARGLDNVPRLLVIGQRGWQSEDVLRRLDALPDGSEVIEVGPADDAALIKYMRSARALLFPSHVEGYGLPLLEALAAGTPVIASDLAVFREVGQDVPDFIDPTDPAAWEAAILDYSRPESAALLAQRQRLAQFRPPTWDDHFLAVDRWVARL